MRNRSLAKKCHPKLCTPCRTSTVQNGRLQQHTELRATPHVDTNDRPVPLRVHLPARRLPNTTRRPNQGVLEPAIACSWSSEACAMQRALLAAAVALAPATAAAETCNWDWCADPHEWCDESPGWLRYTCAVCGFCRLLPLLRRLAIGAPRSESRKSRLHSCKCRKSSYHASHSQYRRSDQPAGRGGP